MDSFRQAVADTISGVLSMAHVKGFVAGLLTLLIGGWRGVHTAFMVLLLVDLILGVWRAAKEHRLSPRVARNKTLAKLGLYWLLIIGAHQVDQVVPTDNFWASEATLIYLALTEFLSILRNASAIYGRPISPWSWPALVRELTGKEVTHGEKGEANGERGRP